MNVPSDWRQVRAGTLTFWVPPELAAAPGQGADSAAGALVGDRVTITYDVGRFGPDLEDLAAEHEVLSTRDRQVAGRTGTEVTFRPVGEPFELARIVQLPLREDVTATVRVSCRVVADCAVADLVFDSITAGRG